jgi:hypothetical protein
MPYGMSPLAKFSPITYLRSFSQYMTLFTSQSFITDYTL